ncbi:two-component system sensor histidine kinase YesM [Paenibacillus baekrokdamisoli]|nr:histidine kinase [Paenibacillus baekrokdamisoli]MBB3070916.1 two-component system sensor histidine kinase YesM [Paenibacillus baekrokdamisoli]
MLIILVCTVGVSISTYIYIKENIEKSTFSNLEQSVQGVSDMLDSYQNEFDNISTQLYLNYDALGNTIIYYLNVLNKSTDSVERLKATQSLDKFILINSSIYQNLYRITLYANSGIIFSNKPIDNNIYKSEASKSWIPSIDPLRGNTFYRYSATDEWTNEKQPAVFSFTRKIDPNDQQSGYIEVQIKAADLLTPVSSLPWEGSDLRLLDDRGNAFYTMKTNKDIEVSSDNYYIFTKTTNKKYIVAELAVSKRMVLSPIRILRNIIIISFSVFLVFSAFFFFFLAKILTNPLRKLKSSIDRIDLVDKHLDIENKYNMNEVDQINRAFRIMNDRLQYSLQQIIQFRTLQLQSHFDTLQSQINPHFLFNMLGVIQALSDKGDTKKINRIIANLADFLRYSTATSSPVTSLNQEVELTMKYLELMKARYLYRLEYSFDIDQQMNDLIVPKLTIQPLVENCLQHGFNDAHPLHIRIIGKVIGDQWELTVQDNGLGFTGSVLPSIRDKVDSYIQQLDYISQGERLGFGGMGLCSTLARMQLTFKNQLHYSVGNNVDKGAYIMMSGNIKFL